MSGGEEKRFYIDHGMIHDRVTGKHVCTDEDLMRGGTAECLDLLNQLSASPASPDREGLREKVAALLDGEAFAEPSSSNLLARELGLFERKQAVARRRADQIVEMVALSLFPPLSEGGGEPVAWRWRWTKKAAGIHPDSPKTAPWNYGLKPPVDARKEVEPLYAAPTADAACVAEATTLVTGEEINRELAEAADAILPLLSVIDLWDDCPFPDAQQKRIAALRTAVAKALNPLVPGEVKP